MTAYAISAKEIGNRNYEITNGRVTLQTAWNPEDGKWLATELFLAGLGVCMLATMMYYGEVNKIDLTGASVRLEADAATKPDRMSHIRVVYQLPAGLSEAQKQALVRAGDKCKVHNTLEHHPEITTTVEEVLPA